MPSVGGLLEERELTARRRVDTLREEADRIQAELVVAERELNEWVIARSRVSEVLSPGDVAGPGDAEEQPDRGEPPALPGSSRRRSRNRWSRYGVRAWPSRHCRRTTSASCRLSRTATGSARAR